ncbi:MAG: dihydrofolate reductase family protein, partial [Candidatus Tumulicola sp.]
MSKLIYIANMSLDGYVEDAAGAFDWVEPAGVHEFITDLLRPMRTYLYGRRVYETMAYWDADVEEYPPERRDFARVWQAAEKIVFSRTLAAATTRRTRIEREFDVEAVRELKMEIGARRRHRRRRTGVGCTRSRSRRRVLRVC